MIAGAIATRLGSLVAQIALAALLVKEDFGVYAIVISIYLLFNSLRDAGVANYLTHRNKNSFDSLSVSAFWLALSFNIIIAILISCVAPFLADYYFDDRILLLLIILAVSIPLRTPASIFITKLSIDGKFILIAHITTVTALIKFGSWILLAWLDFGPYSFVIPIPLIAILESIWTYKHTKVSLWKNSLSCLQCRLILDATIWIIIGQFAVALLQCGDYLVLGVFFSKGMVGIYYFSFELVAQIGALLANNVQKVLFPSLSGLDGKKEEQRTQLLQALTAVMMIGPFLSMLIAISIEPISYLLGWSEKYPGIEQIVQLLSIFFPLRILTIFTSTSLMTLGLFRRLAMINIIQGVGLILIALLMSTKSDDIRVISLVIGIYLGGFSLIFAGFSMRNFGIKLSKIANHVIPLWIIIISNAIIAYILGKISLSTITLFVADQNSISIISIIISGSIFMVLYSFTMFSMPQSRKLFIIAASIVLNIIKR